MLLYVQKDIYKSPKLLNVQEVKNRTVSDIQYYFVFFMPTVSVLVILIIM